MKLMRLKREINVTMEVGRYIFPINTQVEVESEIGGLIQVSVHDVKFDVRPDDLFVPKGMIVTIYRPANQRDYSLRGITSKYEEAILCGPGLDEIFPENERLPALKTWTRSINRIDYTVAIPYDAPSALGRYSFGGNFVFSSDSRMNDAFRPYGIVPVHDRDEGKGK